MTDTSLTTILRANARASRLTDRWLKVHACVFAPRAELTPQREAKIVRICNRIAARIDAARIVRMFDTPRITSFQEAA